MYVLDSGLGDFPRGQCPPIPGAEVPKIISALDKLSNLSSRARVNEVTDVLFINRHPDRLNTTTLEFKKLPSLRSAKATEVQLIQEWGHIRDCMVLPVERELQRIRAKEKQKK
ncbi:MAG TPA: hypothetical protein VIG25_04785 [Pyrinomonadaceae bacterium]|jgi:hypothetical protein